jgi:hypothetical protein
MEPNRLVELMRQLNKLALIDGMAVVHHLSRDEQDEIFAIAGLHEYPEIEEARDLVLIYALRAGIRKAVALRVVAE